jgi:hypothetical protein
MYTPGGGAGAANAQTITAAAQYVGPYPIESAYSIEGDVDFYVVQCKSTVASTISAADILRYGVRVPARTEVAFNPVTAGDYLAWVRVSTSGTDLRVNDRSNAKVS